LESHRPITPTEAAVAAMRLLGLRVDDLSKRNSPRCAVWWAVRNASDMPISLPEASALMGIREHTSLMNGLDRFESYGGEHTWHYWRKCVRAQARAARDGKAIRLPEYVRCLVLRAAVPLQFWRQSGVDQLPSPPPIPKESDDRP